MKYAVGQLIVVEAGYYDAQHVDVVIRVIRDFDAEEQAKAFGSDKYDGFTDYLENKGLIEYVEYESLHLGGYDELNLS